MSIIPDTRIVTVYLNDTTPAEFFTWLTEHAPPPWLTRWLYRRVGDGWQPCSPAEATHTLAVSGRPEIRGATATISGVLTPDPDLPPAVQQAILPAEPLLQFTAIKAGARLELSVQRLHGHDAAINAHVAPLMEQIANAWPEAAELRRFFPYPLDAGKINQRPPLLHIFIDAPSGVTVATILAALADWVEENSDWSVIAPYDGPGGAYATPHPLASLIADFPARPGQLMIFPAPLTRPTPNRLIINVTSWRYALDQPTADPATNITEPLCIVDCTQLAAGRVQMRVELCSHRQLAAEIGLALLRRIEEAYPHSDAAAVRADWLAHYRLDPPVLSQPPATAHAAEIAAATPPPAPGAADEAATGNLIERLLVMRDALAIVEQQQDAALSPQVKRLLEASEAARALEGDYNAQVAAEVERLTGKPPAKPAEIFPANIPQSRLPTAPPTSGKADEAAPSIRKAQHTNPLPGGRPPDLVYDKAYQMLVSGGIQWEAAYRMVCEQKGHKQSNQAARSFREAMRRRGYTGN